MAEWSVRALRPVRPAGEDVTLIGLQWSLRHDEQIARYVRPLASDLDGFLRAGGCGQTGFVDEGQRASMLRAAAPSADTLAWVCELLDATGVVGVAEMPGGSAAAMHRVRVSLRSGCGVEVALRRYVLTDPAEAPSVARWEANALGLAGRASVPTPDEVHPV